MKQLFQFLVLALLVAPAADAQNSNTVRQFRETFSFDRNVSVSGLPIKWAAVYSTPGTTTYTAGTSYLQYSLGHSASFPLGAWTYSRPNDYGYLHFNGGGKYNFLYTTKGVTYSRTGKKMSEFRVTTAHQYADDSTYVAVEVGGSWYIYSNTGANQFVAAGSNNSTAFSIGSNTIIWGPDESTAMWRKLGGLASGQYISIGALQKLDTVAGDVTNYGLFFVKGANLTGALRADNFEITMTSSTLNVPAAPASLTQSGNTLSFPASSGYSTYEYSLNSERTWTTHNGVSSGTNTISGLPFDSVYFAPYQVSVRVKAVASTNTVSASTVLATEVLPANLVYAEQFHYTGSTATGTVGWTVITDTIRSGTSYLAVNPSQSTVSSANGSSELASYNGYFSAFTFQEGFLGRGYPNCTINFWQTSTAVSIPIIGKFISKWEVFTAHGDNLWGTRLAAQVNSTTWYVQGTPIPQPAAQSNFNTPYKVKRSLTEGEATWYQLTITPETTAGAGDGSIVLSSTPVAFPTTGTITKVGMYCSRTASANNVSTRIDGVKLFMQNAASTGMSYVPFYMFNFN